MRLLAGLDPGGARAFGWCVAEDADTPPLKVRATGIANHAADAVAQLTRHTGSDAIVGLGIDAPLFWALSGDRQVDRHVRARVRTLGSPGATVNHVSSMRGACLVQGVMAGLLLRDRVAAITEAHPKAMLWLLGEATRTKRPDAITLASLPRWFDVPEAAGRTEHERDAALGALSAWAMIHSAPGWSDLRPMDGDAVSPVGPVAYWMPHGRVG